MFRCRDTTFELLWILLSIKVKVSYFSAMNAHTLLKGLSVTPKGGLYQAAVRFFIIEVLLQAKKKIAYVRF